MNLNTFHRHIVIPGLVYLDRCHGVPINSNAEVLLCAIAQQESALRYRAQVPVAYAMGWFQFEAGGGVAGVMSHKVSKDIAKAVCEDLLIGWNRTAIHQALRWNDTLAVVFARLLLRTDPKPLPLVTVHPVTAEDAWQYYLRNWRPGKPHREKWDAYWNASVKQVGG